jgi:Winged helix DNA-binding domain
VAGRRPPPRAYGDRVAAPVLTDRALNRALLARQGLLQRTARPALDLVEHLVGLQAQEPANPYLALWSRLERFDPHELSALVADGRAVRGQLMRATIHLVSARDYALLQPLTRGVLAQVFKNAFRARLGDAPVADVVAAGIELLAAKPCTRAELGAALARRWPDAEPTALAHAVTFHAPLVQVPPRGLWRATGQATWALARDGVGAAAGGAAADDGAARDALVLRYLAAFGPAAVADIRTWSGVTGLRAVAERLRPSLRAFRDERGRELLDVESGPLPGPDTPAPPRFLPEYDNVALSHADRSRLLPGGAPAGFAPRGGGWLLVDGLHRAHWQLVAGRDAATLTIDRFAPRAEDPPGTVDHVAAEGRAMLAFLAPEAAAHRVQFVPAVSR